MRMKLAATAAIALAAMPLSASADGEVNIYSYRQATCWNPCSTPSPKKPALKRTSCLPSKAFPSAWSAKAR